MKIFIKFSIFVVLVAFDQLSKYLIRHFGGFYVCNPDISWGISVSAHIFWMLWMAIIVSLLFLLFKKNIIYNQSANEAGSFFAILILAGAVANIIDRIEFGCVIDFINLKFWPVFNLADAFIVLGAVFLLAKWRKL